MKVLSAMKKVAIASLLLASVFHLTGCGGTGGGASGTSQDTDPVACSSTAVVQTLGAPTTLYGVQFRIEFAPGVTLAADSSGNLAPGAIVPSGGAAGATVVTNYQAAANPPAVTVSLIKMSGFPVGECLTVTALVDRCGSMAPGDLTLSEFKAYEDPVSGEVQGSITGTLIMR